MQHRVNIFCQICSIVLLCHQMTVEQKCNWEKKNFVARRPQSMTLTLQDFQGLVPPPIFELYSYFDLDLDLYLYLY